MSSPNFSAFKVLFGHDESLIAALTANCRVRRYRKGEIILHQQGDSSEVHCVLSGHAKAYLLSADGREVWMNEFTTGAMFGEIAAITGSARVCSIAAFTPVESAVFKGPGFLQLMREHGELGVVVSRVLARRLFMTSQRLYMASVESLEGRVIVELLDRAMPCEGDTDYTHIIRPVPVIAEIARKLGSARESVSRIVAALAKDGYIVRGDTEWLLKNPHQLIALSL